MHAYTNLSHTTLPLCKSYLRHSHEQLILSSIEEGRRETLADFQRGLARGMARDWQRHRARIFEELGQHNGTADFKGVSISFACSTSPVILSLTHTLRHSSQDLPRSTPGPARGTEAAAPSQLHGRMMRYDAVISKLNTARLDSLPFTLASALGAAAAGGSDSSAPLREAWDATARIIGERPLAGNEAFAGPVVRQRQFALAYGPAWNGPEGRELRAQITRGALEFLQAQ